MGMLAFLFAIALVRYFFEEILIPPMAFIISKIIDVAKKKRKKKVSEC